MSNRRILIRSASPEHNSILSIRPVLCMGRDETNQPDTAYYVYKIHQLSQADLNSLLWLRNKRPTLDERRPCLLHYIIRAPKSTHGLWFYNNNGIIPNPIPLLMMRSTLFPLSSSNELNIRIFQLNG